MLLTSEEDFFCQSAVLSTSSTFAMLRRAAECSPALSGASISSRAPCGRANSACLTSGTSWSTDINNTPFFPSLCMFRPFGSHHEVHLRPSPSRLDNAYVLRVNDRVTVYGLQLTALARRDRLTSGGHDFNPLSHSWNIYQHNPSSPDQLHTCHGCTINCECVSNKDQSYWFLSLLWDGFTRRNFGSVVF